MQNKVHIMRANEFDLEYYNPSEDKFQQAQISDTRKPRLTLKHLNKLKKMRAAQDLENHMRTDTLEIIYGAPDDESASMGGL
jgi:hypothetical protein